MAQWPCQLAAPSVCEGGWPLLRLLLPVPHEKEAPCPQVTFFLDDMGGLSADAQDAQSGQYYEWRLQQQE